MMRFWNHFRSRPKAQRQKNPEKGAAGTLDHDHPAHPYTSPRSNPTPTLDPTTALPQAVLSRIFRLVCPHAADDSYRSSEETVTGDGCVLCDMRDLAHCALVCHRWYHNANPLLYTHIRIDVVHYCEREVELSAKRKRRSFFDRNGESIDAPAVRLELLMCSVRSSQKLGAMTRSLRIPYMTREACRADLARTVSAMPNLRYVDLPTGVFRDDPLCHALKQELMARCPDLRRFSYAQGSEGSFSRLAQSPVWPNLEVLEVCGLLIESHVLRRVLGEYSRLRELTLDGLDWLEDSALAPNDSLNAFPTVERLTLRNDRNITAAGLTVLLMSNGHRHALKHLTLSSTGVLPHSLHQILAVAPHLRSLSYIQQVSRSLPLEPVVPDLTSASLTTLHFEITPDENLSTAVSVTSSHYQYLRCSLRSNALPALRELYVRDADFAESLLRHLPHNQPQDGRSGELLNSSDVTSLSQPLNIYSKGLEEMEWTFTAYDPSSSLDLAQTRRPRPVSFFDAHLGPSWGGDARKSVLVGNGFGGFLAVPAEADQPRDSRYKRESRQDLWR